MVTDLVDALDREDWAATSALVDEGQLALLAAVESDGAVEASEMVEAGPPPAVRDAFWSSFVESLATFSGRDLSKGEIGDPDRFRVGSVRFAAVPFQLGRRASHDWVLRMSPDGWKVDLLATFGARFAMPLHDWLVAVEGTPEVARVRQALQRDRASLEAAADRGGAGGNSPAEGEAVRRLLGYLARF